MFSVSVVSGFRVVVVYRFGRIDLGVIDDLSSGFQDCYIVNRDGVVVPVSKVDPDLLICSTIPSCSFRAKGCILSKKIVTIGNGSEGTVGIWFIRCIDGGNGVFSIPNPLKVLIRKK